MLHRPVCLFRRRFVSYHLTSTEPLAQRGQILLASLVMACAASLAGCGASLDEGVQSGLVSQEKKTETSALPNALTTPAADAKSAAAPAHVAKEAAVFTASATPGNSAYKIGPQDVLEISVFKVPELSRSVQVADVGTINLPLLGEVQAAGKTSRDLEQDLAAKLGAKYLQSPQVTVYVKEYNSRRVTVDGAVKKPGVYPIRGKTTLVQFIAMAEGLTDLADASSVAVFRSVNGKRSLAKFDFDEIRNGGADDPVIEEGDVIIVSESITKTAFQNFLKALPLTSVFVPLL